MLCHPLSCESCKKCLYNSGIVCLSRVRGTQFFSLVAGFLRIKNVLVLYLLLSVLAFLFTQLSLTANRIAQSLLSLCAG